MLELIFTQYGSQIAIAILGAIGGAITAVTTYSTATRKNGNEHSLALLQEVLKDNKRDEESLQEIVKMLKEKNESLKYLEITCEREKGLLEVENIGLQQEIDFLVNFWGQDDVMKQIIENIREREGNDRKFFKHADIDKIYDKIIHN